MSPHLNMLQEYNEPMQIWTTSTGRTTIHREKAPVEGTPKMYFSRSSIVSVRESA